MKKVKIFPFSTPERLSVTFIAAILIGLFLVMNVFSDSNSFERLIVSTEPVYTQQWFWILLVAFLCCIVIYWFLNSYHRFEICNDKFTNHFYRETNIETEKLFSIVAIIGSEDFGRKYDDVIFAIIRFPGDISYYGKPDVYAVAFEKDSIKHEFVVGGNYLRIQNVHMNGIYAQNELSKK